MSIIKFKTKNFLVPVVVACQFMMSGGCSSSRNIGSGADLSSFPKGSTPQEIGKKLANHFIATPHTNFGRPTPPKVITYPETCTWYGALTFAKVTNDKELASQLAKRFEPLFHEESSMVPVPDHVDYAVFGAVPLELYMHTKDAKYLDMGKRIADKQWDKPEGPRAKPESFLFFNRGLTWQTRMWVDDMFMIIAVQSQAYRATGDRQYIDRAANEMVVYLDSLQQPNGLFYHAPDVPFFWGRGNGWFAAGMSELLRSLPADNPNRPRIMQGYKSMMASLLKYQADDGMWRQLIDDPASWKENFTQSAPRGKEVKYHFNLPGSLCGPCSFASLRETASIADCGVIISET